MRLSVVTKAYADSIMHYNLTVHILCVTHIVSLPPLTYTHVVYFCRDRRISTQISWIPMISRPINTTLTLTLISYVVIKFLVTHRVRLSDSLCLWFQILLFVMLQTFSIRQHMGQPHTGPL